jgi:hypothetical protein
MASDYEQVRLANIERNKNFLRDIGFVEGVTPSLTHRLKSRKRQRSPSKTKVIPPELCRRSARVSLLSLPNYKEERVVDGKDTILSVKRERLRNIKVDLSLHKKGVNNGEGDINDLNEDPPPQANSSRALIANLDVFLDVSLMRYLQRSTYY